MPFKKIGKNKYKSPSGRLFSTKQVEAYHTRITLSKYGGSVRRRPPVGSGNKH